MYTVFYLVFSFSCLFEKCIFIFGTHRNKSWYIPNNKQTKFNQQSLESWNCNVVARHRHSCYIICKIFRVSVQNLERRKATSLLDQYTVKLQLSQRVHRSLNLDRMTGQKVMKRKTIIWNTYIHNCLVAKRIFTSYLLKRRPHIEMDEQRLRLFEG